MSGFGGDSNKTDEFDNSTVVLVDENNQKIGTTEGRLNVDVKLSKNNGQVDSSGRVRMTLPIELTSKYFSNTEHILKMNTTLAGGSTGTVALTLNKGSVAVTNSTGNGHKINFSSKKYIRYTPGQTHKCTIAGNFGNGATNVEKRWGMFTEFNGFFFKQTSTGLSIVVRRGGGGDPVTESTVVQADWNLDKLDGTGTSGFNLNTANHGIFIIEFDWHGAGVIRYGIKFGQEILYCHQQNYDFTQADTSTRSPNLPVNIEIKNVGVASSPTTILCTAFSVYKDGESSINTDYIFSTSNGVNGRTVGNGASLPLISIRPKLSFKGILARIGLVPNKVEILSTSNNLYIQVILNGTLTGASFASVNDESNAERDVSATAITGGVIVWEGYITAGTSLLGADTPGTKEGNLGLWELNVNYAGTVAETLTVTARSLGNNNTTYASVAWLEYQ